MDDSNNYQIPVETLISLEAEDNLPALVKVDKNSIHFPDDLARQLAKNKVIAVTTDNGELIFFKQIAGELYSYGTIKQVASINSSKEQLIQFSFLIVLALAFLVVLIPIAKDVTQIQIAANHFAKQPSALNINVKHTSIVYPIAQTMMSMSNQIVELIKLQKDLAITVAHEIRTPLSRLKFVHKQIAPSISNKNSLRILKDIEEINTLASDYLTYSKLDTYTNELDAEMKPLHNLAELIEEKFEIYQDKFQIQVTSTATSAQYNLQEMLIATQNLVMNAMRYTKSTILIELESNLNHALIKVRDDGKGISGKRASIIEQFNRKARDKNDFGFGLGLYITNLVALKHAGALSVDNDKKLGGAIFTIRWPTKQNHVS